MGKADYILKNWLHSDANLPALLQSEWAQTSDLLHFLQTDSGICIEVLG